jgi:protein-tyrosine kinase
MGKIFDALEKATQRASADIPLTRQRESATEQILADKVVQLPNPNKIVHEQKLDPNLIAYHAPQSIEAELFKVLRTNLLFPAEGKAPRIILVTSALPADGKSFMSANMAISIAQGIEEHVLLIDCDVRKPTIHSLFGFTKVPGLAEYLANGTDLSQVLLKTPLQKLTILPAGTPPANPTELLSSKKMKALLEEVKHRYEDRYIIIDSPPPSMAAETNAIINNVDGVILVINAGKTLRNAVSETIEQIGKDKIMGIVLNQTQQSVKKYYGYVKSYYQKKE